MTLKAPTFPFFINTFLNMTATLSIPTSAAVGMLAKGQNGNEILNILDAIVDTQEDQVPMPSDAYVMENDFCDEIEF